MNRKRLTKLAQQLAPRPIRPPCPTCGGDDAASSQVRVVRVTEPSAADHWVCPQCGRRWDVVKLYPTLTPPPSIWEEA